MSHLHWHGGVRWAAPRSGGLKSLRRSDEERCIQKRGVMPRWPKREEGMEKSLGARRRKPETSKTDLKPLLGVLRRTGCPSRGGIRRVCGEVPGRSRWGLPQGRTGRPKVGQGRARTMGAKAFSFTHRPKVFA